MRPKLNINIPLFPVVFSKYDVPPPFHSRKEKILLFIS